MDKVTYLMGAGASKDALPLAKDLAGRLSDFSEKVLRPEVVKSYGTNGQSFPDEYVLHPNGPFGKGLIDSFTWLGKEAKRHASVDTLAKKFFIRDNEEARKSLYKLKVALSCYLLLEQSLNPVDKRYDSFLASILKPGNGKPHWPEGVGIVTWNYDTQLEKSYKEFCSESSLVYEDVTNSRHVKRLNGVCGTPDAEDMRDLCHLDFSKTYFDLLQNLFDAQMKKSEKYLPSISFAWEKKASNKSLTDIITDTSTLVVIGYSFPYFNREIDWILFRAMSRTLNKVFIQVPDEEQSPVKDRLLTLFEDSSREDMKKKIVPVSIGSFFIPDNMPA